MLHGAAAICKAARAVKPEAVIGWVSGCPAQSTWLAGQMLAALPAVAFVNVNTGYFTDNHLRLSEFASLLRILPVRSAATRR